MRDPRVQQVASVHPATVTEHSQMTPRRRRTRKEYDRRAHPEVTTTTVHPAALQAAGGDMARIEILDDGSYFIHNHRDWRKR